MIENRKGNYSIILVILIGIVMMVTNVHAEEISISELPKEFAAGEFFYTIEGFEIKIYDASKDEQGNSKYFSNKDVLYTISVTDNTLTINPEELVSSMNGVNGTFINLNLSVNKDKIESLVKSKITSLNNGDNYACELVVKYKLSNIPTKYPFMTHINTIDLILSIFTGKFNGMESVRLNTSTDQVLNLGALTKENGVVEFNWDEEAVKEESGGTESFAVLDYVYLSQTEEIDLINSPDSNQSYIFMFHNLDNIEKLLQSYNQIYDNQLKELENQEKKQDQIVNVSNTALSFSKVLLGIGGFIIIVGIFIIVLSIKKGNPKINE